MVVQCENAEELEQVIANLEGQLTGTVISDNDEILIILSNFSITK